MMELHSTLLAVIMQRCSLFELYNGAILLYIVLFLYIIYAWQEQAIPLLGTLDFMFVLQLIICFIFCYNIIIIEWSIKHLLCCESYINMSTCPSYILSSKTKHKNRIFYIKTKIIGQLSFVHCLNYLLYHKSYFLLQNNKNFSTIMFSFNIVH